MKDWLANRRAFLVICGWLALAACAPASPAAEPDRSEVFTVVLMPDTQFYCEKYPDTYVRQTMWIRERVKDDNLKFCISLGDIVQHSDIEQEWINANNAAKILDGVLPYSMVPGNHDLAFKGDALTHEAPLFNKYFPAARYDQEPWYGDHKGDDNRNNYCFFEGAGKKFLVLSLEFGPTDETLVWAEEVCKKHPDHNIILATHSYLGLKGRTEGPQRSYKMEGNSGDQMWEKLVKKQANIFMVASGHVSGVNMQVSTNEAGRPVIEILTDYQDQKDGGEGWLRTMKFVPRENKIYVTAYSPLLKKYNNDPKETHTIDLDFSKLR